jgi:hypothetical protein
MALLLLWERETHLLLDEGIRVRRTGRSRRGRGFLLIRFMKGGYKEMEQMMNRWQTQYKGMETDMGGGT